MREQTIPSQAGERPALQVQSRSQDKQTERDKCPAVTELLSHIAESLEGCQIVRPEKPQDRNIDLEESSERPDQRKRGKHHRRSGGRPGGGSDCATSGTARPSPGSFMEPNRRETR